MVIIALIMTLPLNNTAFAFDQYVHNTIRESSIDSSHTFNDSELQSTKQHWSLNQQHGFTNESNIQPFATNTYFSGDVDTRSVGRLKYSKDGGNYMCSAALVDGASGHLLITAAHCLHGGKGKTWFANFVFEPDYPNAQDGFLVRKVVVFKEWTDNVDVNTLPGMHVKDDVGFVVLDNPIHETASPASIYGSNSIAFDPLSYFSARIVGYPGNPGNHESRQFCDAYITPRPLYAEELTTNGCGYINVQGASGGPWIQYYDQASHTGVVTGVTSSFSGNNLFSAQFTSRVQDLYNTVR